jgi:hypothetical protein
MKYAEEQVLRQLTLQPWLLSELHYIKKEDLSFALKVTNGMIS